MTLRRYFTQEGQDPLAESVQHGFSPLRDQDHWPHAALSLLERTDQLCVTAPASWSRQQAQSFLACYNCEDAQAACHQIIRKLRDSLSLPEAESCIVCDEFGYMLAHGLIALEPNLWRQAVGLSPQPETPQETLWLDHLPDFSVPGWADLLNRVLIQGTPRLGLPGHVPDSLPQKGLRSNLNLSAFVIHSPFPALDKRRLAAVAKIGIMALAALDPTAPPMIGFSNAADILLRHALPYDSPEARGLLATIGVLIQDAASEALSCSLPAAEMGRLRGGDELAGIDSAGIEPLTSLIQQQPGPGGLMMRIIHPAVPAALQRLGYNPRQIRNIIAYVIGHSDLRRAPVLHHDDLYDLGFEPWQIERIESELTEAEDIRHVFNPWVLGHAFCTDVLGLAASEIEDPAFDMLAALGFAPEEATAAARWCCGARMMEAAPHLKPEHLPLFDCRLSQGESGLRRVSVESRLMMAGHLWQKAHLYQSDALELPAETNAEDLHSLIRHAADLGLPQLAVWRTTRSA